MMYYCLLCDLNQRFDQLATQKFDFSVYIFDYDKTQSSQFYIQTADDLLYILTLAMVPTTNSTLCYYPYLYRV